jgi:hypothetical protein
MMKNAANEDSEDAIFGEFEVNRENLGCDEELRLRRALDFFSGRPKLVDDELFNAILKSQGLDHCAPAFILCLRKCLTEERLKLLISRGFVGDFIALISNEFSVDLTCEVLRLLSIIGNDVESGCYLVSLGIMEPLVRLSHSLQRYDAGAPAFPRDHSKLFDSVLKCISSLVRWASLGEYSSFFVKVCDIFPQLSDLNPVHSYRHIYTRRLLKFVQKLFAYGSEDLLSTCKSILPFVMLQLQDSCDVAIQGSALIALTAVSSRSDHFSITLVELGFLKYIRVARNSANFGYICSILRNFAAAENENVIESLFSDIPMGFLLNLIDHESFDLKQKAWFVLSYLIQVRCDMMLPIFEAKPEYFGSLGAVLSGSSDEDFIEAVIFALRRLFDAEERIAEGRGAVNRAAAAFSDAGLLMSITDLNRRDSRLCDVVADLVTDIEGALSLDIG